LVRADSAAALREAEKLDVVAAVDPKQLLLRANGRALAAICHIASGRGREADDALSRSRDYLLSLRKTSPEDRDSDALLISLARAESLGAMNAILNPFEGAEPPAARVAETYQYFENWVQSETVRSLQSICAKDPRILEQYELALRMGQVEPVGLTANWNLDGVLSSELGPSALIAIVLPRAGRGKQGLDAGRKLLELLADVNPREFVTAGHSKDWNASPDPFEGMKLLDVPGIAASPVFVTVRTSISSFPRELGQIARSILGDFKAAAELLDPVIERAAAGTQMGDLATYVDASLERAGVAMDARDGDGAERIVAKVLERLDGVKKTYSEDFDDEAVKRLGASADALKARARGWLELERKLRSQSLITRAVNENVVRGRPAVASGYAKTGVALEPTEFNRVLLACYLAREGNSAESRAVLRDAVDVPGNYYNLACTYALLGERDTSLFYLEKDFQEHKDAGGLERQRSWARKDPDLQSLRTEERFQSLVGATASRPAETQQKR
jgi:tetratricopeptide (TPR) repeat protein